jgi:hypothetical protein
MMRTGRVVVLNRPSAKLAVQDGVIAHLAAVSTELGPVVVPDVLPLPPFLTMAAIHPVSRMLLLLGIQI